MKSKNKESRVISIHPKVTELLEIYLSQILPLNEKALFVGNQGKRLNKNSLVDIFKKYLQKSGIINKKN